MKDNQIIFNVKDGQVTVKYKNPTVFTDFLQISCTAILLAMQTTLAHVPEPNKQEAKEDLYDMFNAAASNTLAYFAPDIEMRPHLTTQAILEAEDNMIKEGRATPLTPQQVKQLSGLPASEPNSKSNLTRIK